MKQISTIVETNLFYARQALHFNKEVITRTVSVAGLAIGMVYVDTIASKDVIQNHIMRPLLQLRSLSHEDAVLSVMNTIEIADAQVLSSMEEAVAELTNGKTLLFIEGTGSCIVADTSDWKDRSLAPPQTQRVLKGPQIGFTELAKNNLSLIKRVVKNADLVIEEQSIGEETQTNVSVVYLAEKVDTEILRDVKERLAAIELSAILDSSYIEEVMTDKQQTTFPLVLVTERPDVTAAHLLEGKIVIVCDGSPNVIIVPALFIQFLQSPEDYYEPSFLEWTRLLRILSFVVSIYLIPLYIAFTLFHPEMIPSELLINLAAQRQVVPLPVLAEVLLFMLMFQIVLESSIRLPSGLTLAFAIIGTIILGQSAAQAGLVQLATLVVVSATYVLNFAVPVQPFANSVKTIRYLFVFLASTFGFYGIMLGTIALVIHLCSLQSFRVPYLSPIMPLHIPDLKDTFVRMSLKKIVNTKKKYKTEQNQPSE
ncbi:spore germination protein [Ectobacillus antri]|uniref:Spore germination protein n=1 Tax=Ectobacillus antri TaxID=2486280 RepID=A0ABT6H828_9BACI|nr:spore germination protein [Ectobacillus antri]MDG4657789.1 spore germination protein [Ectobacillus antri]MDG5754820.1 spore germination protein [Ectobacillus antri]